MVVDARADADFGSYQELPGARDLGTETVWARANMDGRVWRQGACWWLLQKRSWYNVGCLQNDNDRTSIAMQRQDGGGYLAGVQ
jgi:hypothetical protein